MNPSKIIIISAPSGTGKNTIIKKLKEKRGDLEHCISTTTRSPREGETEGSHYYFTTPHQFKEMIANHELLEWATILNNYYGTTKKEISRIHSLQKTPILDIDIQGGLQIKNSDFKAILIFVIPPSIDELKTRLKNRNSESEEEIKRRLELAEEELLYQNEYDHVVMNDNLEDAVNKIDAIITSELT